MATSKATPGSARGWPNASLLTGDYIVFIMITNGYTAQE